MSLFTCAGVLLVRLDAPTVTIEGEEYGVELGKELVVTRWERTDNFREKRDEAVKNRSHEIQKRQEDLALVMKDIARLAAIVEAGEDDADEASMEWGRMMALKGKHKRAIKELESSGEVSVAYTEQLKGKSATLREGVISNVPFFSVPVFWCSDFVLEDNEEIREHRVTVPDDYVSAEVQAEGNFFYYFSFHFWGGRAS
jgi:hypothetical protein